MSFDVFLIETTASPKGSDLVRATDEALRVCGARRGRSGEMPLVLASGGEVEFYSSDDETAGGMFALRGESPEVIELVFRLADATRCFIIFPSDEPALLRTPGNSGDLLADSDAPPRDAADAPIVPITDARQLAELIQGGFTDWADYAAQVAGSTPDDDEDDEDIDVDPTLLDRFFKPSK